MRGLIPGLENPHPLGLTLPAIYQEDDLAQRFCSALDDVLAPVLSTLDCFDAYLDPKTTPDDFLEWLAGWVGLVLDENWPVERRRQLIAEAGELFSRRGTARGLHDMLRLYVDAEVEIVENGGAVWSAAPNGEAPGGPEPRVTVRVRVPNGEAHTERIAGLVGSVMPAHIVHEVEVL
jgi:phage tail-like protein